MRDDIHDHYEHHPDTPEWGRHMMQYMAQKFAVITHLQEKLMSAISDYVTKVEADYAAISTGLDSLATGIANLDALITQLQNNPGPISPVDQGLLDEAQAQSTALVAKVASISTDPPAKPAA